MINGCTMDGYFIARKFNIDEGTPRDSGIICMGMGYMKTINCLGMLFPTCSCKLLRLH